MLFSLPGWSHNEEEETTLEFLVQGTQLRLEYTTHFPSMASFVQLKQLDADKDEVYSETERAAFLNRRFQEYQKHVDLKFQGQPVSLALVSSTAKIKGDTLGLKELSATFVLEGDLPEKVAPGDHLTLSDPTFGWNSFRVTSDHGGGSEVKESSVGDTMDIVFTADAAPAMSASSDHRVPAEHDNKLVAMVDSEMTPGILLAALGLAFVLGALHALTPGHGKTMVAAYLVGSRGTIRQAAFLGLVVTFTHTLSVFLLGLLCMVAFEYVVPETIIPWMGFASGVLVSVVGGVLLAARLSGRELGHGHSHEHGHSHSHGHSHGHSHAHDHSPARHIPETSELPQKPGLPQGHSHSHSSGNEHSHQHTGAHSHSHHNQDATTDVDAQISKPTVRDPETDPKDVPQAVSLWALISLGVSGGMVPCPEALVVLLAAISLNKLWLGMLVLVFFSAGLASLLIIIGILVVTATKMSKSFYPSEETIRKISIASYVFICGLGMVIAIRSLTDGGILTINL